MGRINSGRARPALTVCMIEKIIADRFDDPQFDVKRLAASLGVSTQYLYEVVNIALGVTPRRLIESLRLRKAAQLINERRRPMICV